MKEKKKLLSIIVPAYKAEKTIEEDLRRIEEVAKQLRYDYEIICVADGKTDKTFEKAKNVVSQKIKVLGYKLNQGKGFAVRYGMTRAKGDYVAFIDAGMDIDPNGISLILEHMEWYEADIIVGSKRHPASEIEYPFSRRILSFTAQMIIWVLLGLRVRDTQVGLKIFRKKVLDDVLPRLLLKRFAFDVELLAVANSLGYHRIYEAPVKLQCNFGSTVKIFGGNGIFQALTDVLAVFYRLKILHYYADSNRRKWRLDPELNLRINTGEFNEA